MEFEDSDSGKHKVARLVDGPSRAPSLRRSTHFSATTVGASRQEAGAGIGAGGNSTIVSARRDSSNSSLTSLANQLGEKEPRRGYRRPQDRTASP